MQLNPLSWDTWRHGHHGACPTPIERDHPLTLQDPTANCFYYILSPENRSSYLLDNSSNSIQPESLAAPMRLEDSAPGVQKHQQPEVALQRLEGKEIAPTDVKYRLQLLEEAPSQRNSSNGQGQHHKPGWIPFSKSHREWFKPWKMEDVAYHRDEPSHSGHMQGRRTAPRGHQSHMEYVSQDQSNTQVPMWSQALSLGLDKSSQGNVQSAQCVPREMAPGWPTTHAHQELSQTKPGTASMGTKSTAKFDEATTSRMACLPPLKLLPRRVQSKWPPHTPGIFQGKSQAEMTGKHFFQHWRAQPQGHYRSNEKPLVPFEDQVHTRLTYMPLFTGRVKLYKPKSK
uniref:uncharacterized protein LOC125389141 n=1 Tax=Myodes glareolus TaxID=447135 RepID=UPI00201FDBFF|nr:uncharacterized protein LOC125389141 [Myodes glareolus]XP_048273544.1 uncharacterized protein LOC125389141 [Myodes glareolus]